MKASGSCKTLAAAMAAVVVMAVVAAAQGTDTAYVPFKVNVDAAIKAQNITNQQEVQVRTGNKTAILKLPIPISNSVLNSGGAPGRLNSPVITNSRGNINLRLPRQLYQNAEVSLYSVNGKQVLRGKAAATKTVNSVSSRNVAAGVYMLSVKGTNSNAFTARLTHSGGRLNVNVAFGAETARQFAATAGNWMVTVSAAGFVDSVYMLNPMAGTNDLQDITLRVLSTYNGYLGYGYDLINQGYYVQGEIKKARALDAVKMDADGLIVDEPYTKSESYVIAGTSISEYVKSYGIALSAGVDGLFGGSVNADFGLDASKRTSEKQSFAKYVLVVPNKRQFLNENSDILLEYLTPEFKADLYNASVTPAQLFNKYGTHIFLELYLGGRLDMNYEHTNKEGASSEKIKASVSASFTGISAHTSGYANSDAREFNENSTFKAIAYGGKNGVFTSYDEAQKGYKEWSASVENNVANMVVRGGIIDPDYNISGMCPIWWFIGTTAPNKGEAMKNAARRAEIIQEFQRQLETAQGMLKDLAPEIFYVNNIYLGSGGSAQSARDALVGKKPANQEMIVLSTDLNHSASGDYIYLGYTKTTNKDSAATKLSAWYNAGRDQTTMTDTGGVIYPYSLGIDANKGAGGPDIFLFYTRDKRFEPIRELWIQDSYVDSLKMAKTEAGWQIVTWGNKGDGTADMNRGSGGADIYIWQKR